MSLLLPKFLYRYLQKKFDLPSPIDKRESIIQSILMPPGGSKAKWSDHDYENFAKETYLKNIIAFRCIDEIGTAVASVKWKVYERKKSGKPVETLTHPVAELIRRPNTEDSYSFLMLKKASFLVMDGNAYEERITPLDGPNVEVPKELYVHRPDRIHIEVGNGRKTGYVYEVEGREKTWRIDPINGECDLWHYKTFHPINDWYGAAVTESAAREIDTSNEATEWNKKMLENEGRPGMVITIVGKNLTDERFEKLEKMLKEKHTGPEHAGANMILEGEKGTTAQPYGWTPKDMDFMEGNRDLSRRIALGFKVPPMLLSIPGDATFCLAEDTRIMTDCGGINIVDMVEGDKVWSLDCNGNLELRTVTWSGQTGVKKLYRIKMRNRTIKATENHPFLVRRSKKNEKGELDYYLEYTQVQDLKEKDIVITLENLPQGDANTSPIGKVTEEHMEFYGFYLGDGNMNPPITKSSGKGYRRGGNICLAIDEKTMDSYGSYYVDLGSRLLNTIPHRNERSMRFCCSEKVREFIKLGFSGTAKEKRIPKWIYKLNRDLKLAFLRGILDSDGSVDTLGYITIALANEELIKDIRDLCISCGISVSDIRFLDRVVKLPNGHPFRSESWWITLARISDCLEIGLKCHTPSYIQKLEKNKNRHKFEHNNLLSTGGKASEEKLKNIVPYKYCRYGRISSIEELNEQPVYDIEVEGNHNFFANGVCVHNSNFEEARLAFWEETVFFYLNFFRDEGNNWHFPKDNRFYLDYALDEIPALAPKRHRMWERAQKSQFITINEKREMVNLPPIDAGDVILVPSNMVPLDILQKEFSEGIENITGNEGTAKKKLMEKGYTEEEAMNLLGLH